MSNRGQGLFLENSVRDDGALHLNTTAETRDTKRGMHINQINDSRMTHAINVIKDTYGEDVYIKPKSLLKYGKTTNADSGALVELMTLPGATQYVESDISDNLITHVSSGDAGDTQACVIEGHTISGDELTYVTQNVTLAGQTKTALATPLYRATRIFNNDSTDITGPVYVYEDVAVTSGKPNTDSAVHLMIAAGKNQSEKAKTAFSNVDYGLITSLYAAIQRTSGANINADVELQIREYNKTWREICELELRTSANQEVFITFDPFIIVPANADVRLVARADTNDTAVVGFFNSYIATVVT